jgi:hypothetical protein
MDVGIARSRSIRSRVSVIGSKSRVGRVQLAVRRSFVTAGGKPLTIADFLPRAFPRTTNHARWMRKSVNRAIPKFGVCLGRIPHERGRPCVWVPNAQLGRLIS